MNRDVQTIQETQPGVPRKRGDEPVDLSLLFVWGWCSPQTRG